MAVESVTVNGVDLNSQATRLEDVTGLYVTPARRTKNITVPGRHGDVRLPQKLYSAGTLVLKMWVLGVDKTTGLIPAGSSESAEFQKRVDELIELFTADLLTIVHTLPDGTARQIVAELDTSPVAFAPENAVSRFGRFNVVLTVPGAFWTDVATASSTITGPTGTAATLTGFAPATAPMTNLTVTFGPCSNPTISQGATSLQYNGIIAAGQQLVVDTGRWTLSPGVGTVWTPVYANIAYSPGPSWFFLDPTKALSVTFTHTEGASASVTIAGKPAYFTA